MKLHKDLTPEKWFILPKSTQIMNICTEVSRAQSWQNIKDTEKVKECIERALELMDLTIQDKKWKEDIGELLRFREGLAYFYSYESHPIIYNFYLNQLILFAKKFM